MYFIKLSINVPYEKYDEWLQKINEDLDLLNMPKDKVPVGIRVGIRGTVLYN